MASVTAITFDDMEQGPQVREALRGLEKQGLLSLDAAAVIVRDADGKFKVHGQLDRGVKWGAGGGALIGLLLGSIFFPIGGIVLVPRRRRVCSGTAFREMIDECRADPS